MAHHLIRTKLLPERYSLVAKKCRVTEKHFTTSMLTSCENQNASNSAAKGRTTGVNTLQGPCLLKNVKIFTTNKVLNMQTAVIHSEKNLMKRILYKLCREIVMGYSSLPL